MSEPIRPVVAYIGAVNHPLADQSLEQKGLCHGLVMFAVPDLGIQFRCRAEADRLRLEIGAFFSLLRFLKTRLPKVKIEALEVRSSLPEFVFSLGGKIGPFAKDTEWSRLLAEYLPDMQITTRYVEPRLNRCLLPPSEFPSVPETAKPLLTPTWEDRTKFTIKPFQRGIDL